MNRKAEDGFALSVIAFTWISMFAASHAWEFVVAGAVTLACVEMLLRKR